MSESQQSLAAIAQHERAEDVLRAAVDAIRARTGVDQAFAAVGASAHGYPIAAHHQLLDPRWAHVVVRVGRGLGGRVALERRPVLAPDYLDDPTITGDYRTIVRAEGLRSVGCVPLSGPDGVTALLYAGDRRVGGLGGRVLDELQRVGEIATVGLTLAAERAAAVEPLLTIAGIARRVADSDDPARLRDALTQIASTCAAAPLRGRSSIRLTPREQDVLGLLADGASNRQIAERLVLSEPTVKGHIRSLLGKLDAGSRLEAVARARREGLA